MNSSSKHETTEDQPPELIVVGDGGLEFGKEVVLNTIPLVDSTPIDSMDSLEYKKRVQSKWCN